MTGKIESASLYEDCLAEILRLRAENEKFYKQAEMNARLLTENASLRAEIEKLHREAAIRIDQIEREQEAHLETIADYNWAAVENEKLREALAPFATASRHFKDDCKDTLVVSIGVDVGYLRAAAAAIRESGE
jgi:hypothetical protein